MVKRLREALGIGNTKDGKSGFQGIIYAQTKGEKTGDEIVVLADYTYHLIECKVNRLKDNFLVSLNVHAKDIHPDYPKISQVLKYGPKEKGVRQSYRDFLSEWKNILVTESPICPLLHYSLEPLALELKKIEKR